MEAIQQEVFAEVERLLAWVDRDQQQRGGIDLEALEFGLRSRMLTVGAKTLECLLRAGDGGYQGASIACACGGQARFVEYRWKQLRTIVGLLQVRRAYYHCEDCGRGQVPLDRLLGMESTSFSPGLCRLSCRVGLKDSFERGSEDLWELAGIEVQAKQVERSSEEVGAEIQRREEERRQGIFSGRVVPLPLKTPPEKVYIAMDGTGVPVVPKEVVNRQGKGEDGKARTREVKLGCVFTQTTFDAHGQPVRDENSTTYVGGILTAEQFGPVLYAEVEQRGLSRVPVKVVLGDGAPWIWPLAEEHFPDAVQIVDLYHARQHVWSVIRALYPEPNSKQKAWGQRRIEELNQGDITALLKAFSRVAIPNENVRKGIQTETQFFQKNRHRMRYSAFRSQGLFVGSGVVEAGCKTVIGQRLKQSGMRWTVRGADAIIALRRCFLSRQWEDFWESRHSA